MIALTVSVKVSLSVSVPVPSSVTVTVISAVPFQSSAGVKVKLVPSTDAVTSVSSAHLALPTRAFAISVADQVTSFAGSSLVA